MNGADLLFYLLYCGVGEGGNEIVHFFFGSGVVGFVDHILSLGFAQDDKYFGSFTLPRLTYF